MSKITKFSTTLLLLVGISACSKKAASIQALALDPDDDSPTLVAESALSVVNGALNDSEQTSSYASLQPSSHDIFSLLIPKAYASSCGLDRFTPAISLGSNCIGTENNSTVTSFFDSCTGGPHNDFIFSGNVKLSFSSPIACNTWVKGLLPIPNLQDSDPTVIRTSQEFTRINPNGSTVTTDSITHLNYLGESIGGGVKTRFTGIGTRSLEIMGLHRKRVRSGGKPGFDHSVTTQSGDPIVVSGLKSLGTRQISSGTIIVDHNRANYSTQASLSGLKWESNTCCYPTDGTVVFSLLGISLGTLVIDFNTGTCGLVEATLPDHTNTQLQLMACE